MIRKLGKRAPRHDPRNLKLAQFITAPLPDPPDECLPINPMTNLGQMLNDELGDCTIAAAGHMIQSWTANVGKQVILPDAAILQAYEGACGYQPGKPSTDEGGVELDVLNYWRKTGIGGHAIGAHATVDLHNIKLIKQAISIFGGVYTGFELPSFVLQGDDPVPWVFPKIAWGRKYKPNPNNGHAVPLLYYNRTGPLIVSWGTLLQGSWDFVARCCDEIHAVISPDQLNDSGKTPAGFDNDRLAAALELVT